MKKVFIILGSLTAAVILAILIFVLTFDINTYKTRIEAVASDATRMKVRIEGRIKLSLFPRPGISFENILIQNQGVNVASAKKGKVGIKLLPLLRQEIVVQQIRLIAPAIFITKDSGGLLNLEAPDKKYAKYFGVRKMIIEEGRFLYLDEKSGWKIEANECDFTAQNLSGGVQEFLSTLSFDGRLSCGEVRTKELRISDASAVMKAREGEFEADPVALKIFGGDGKGSIKAVLSGENPGYSVDFAITKFRFEEASESFKQKKSFRGALDLKSHIEMKGKNASEMTRTAQGEISLRGRNLMLEGLDLDSSLEKYKKSQRFNLVDVGAFFIAGPWGTLLTKGYDFGSVYRESLGGASSIGNLVSDWKVKNGVAEAEDVAFTTSKNRFALKGRLDFVRDRFDNVTVAVLDAKGCATYSQRIHGPFKKPQIDKPSILHSLAGPLISLAKKPLEMLKWDECKVFYRGSLKQP